MKVSFKEVRQLNKYKNKNVMFCESCLCANPDMKQGYTECCNELRVTYPISLRLAKQNDILNALQTRYTASSNGDLRMYFNNGINSNIKNSDNTYANFVLPNKNKTFKLNMEQTEKRLIECLSLEIKGLRKEF
jgi:hypothetical protein